MKLTPVEKRVDELFLILRRGGTIDMGKYQFKETLTQDRDTQMKAVLEVLEGMKKGVANPPITLQSKRAFYECAVFNNALEEAIQNITRLYKGE